MRSVFSRPGRDFASILDSLEDEALCDFVRPVAGAERFWPGEPGAESPGAAAVASRYAENQVDAGASARFGRSEFRLPDFNQIAAEIAWMSSADRLRALRRKLALATHPDRVPIERRAEAERLMAKVNAAIDAALSRL